MAEVWKNVLSCTFFPQIRALIRYWARLMHMLSIRPFVLSQTPLYYNSGGGAYYEVRIKALQPLIFLFVWHEIFFNYFSAVKRRLLAVAKKYSKLREWIRSILNHLYWCALSSHGLPPEVILDLIHLCTETLKLFRNALLDCSCHCI